MKAALLMIGGALFLLAAFGVPFGPVHLGWMGLVFLAAAFLVPPTTA